MRNNPKIYTLILLVILIVSCNREKKYVPKNLKKLTENELIKRAKNKTITDFEKVVFKNERGEILALDSVKILSKKEEFTSDKYVDKNGIIKEMILRKTTPQDKILLIKLQKLANQQSPNVIVDIDCNMKSNILEEIYFLDQNMRANNNSKKIDSNIDKQNLNRVISLIKKCGMPTLKEVTKKQMSAIWLVFQHADNKSRKKYFPLLKESAKNGDLDISHIALMEDRILISEGKPQIYGSQIILNEKTKKWEIYKLIKPNQVDKRRLKVGLGSLKEYAKNWNIEFNTQQEK